MDKHSYREDEVDLVDYIKVIYKRRRMIITLILVSMFFAGAFSLLKPAYEAYATFFPMDVKEYYSPQAETLAMKKHLNAGNLIISVLESRKMADRIIEQLNLKKVWDKELMIDTRKILGKLTDITRERNGIIKLSVQTKSPELSVRIANAYVDNLDYFNRQLDIGAQRNIVQVIDKATVPEKRMPRGTIKNTLLAGIVSFMFAIFLAFFLEFVQKSNIKNRLKEK